MNQLTTINPGLEMTFSENPDIAKRQAETIQHALILQSRIVTDPIFNHTKQVEVKAKVQSEFNSHLFNFLSILVAVFVFMYLISIAWKIPSVEPAPRTVEVGDLENQNKLLQWELVLAKRELALIEKEKASEK
jgi:hypothetical protein